MAERHSVDQQQTPESQMQSPASRDDMIACVMALEAALLPCLPARELQAIDRSAHPYHQIDVERHARDFMEAAKKLQLYLIGLQREDLPSKPDMLRKEIAKMEAELKTKTELISKQERLILEWRKELNDQLGKHNMELERVVEGNKLATEMTCCYNNNKPSVIPQVERDDFLLVCLNDRLR